MKAQPTKPNLPELISRHQSTILQDWTQLQLEDGASRSRITETEMREHSRRILDSLEAAGRGGDVSDFAATPWNGVREILTDVCKARARAGFTPSETARFVFSLKQVLFAVLRREFAADVALFADETWAATVLLDNLGLFTTEVAIRTREEVVSRQQLELMELSTPVVKLWDGIVAVPLIGTLDSERTQIVMESLLERVVETGAAIAIIDITGVPTVDTLVAQHLLKTIAAARLMGAECIISGIRPQIAATIVHLGVDLGNVITKSTLADAFALAMRRLGLTVREIAKPQLKNRKDEEHGTDSDS